MKNLDFDKSNINCPTDCLPLQDMSYERLEFLGDSLLGMIVANYLYTRFPDQNEGFLSKIRTKIVNGKMLGFLSEKIGFPKFAIISKQVEEAGGRKNFKIMEDIFEAFIGALFLDFQSEEDEIVMPKHIKIIPFSGAGYFIVEQWIIYIIENYIDFTELIRIKNNYKDMLVSYMQHQLQDVPRFYEINVVSKDNNRVFTYCVKDRNNTVLATATGNTKKESENNVAKEALNYYGINIDEFNFNMEK
jgi:ribonuclease-3